MSSILRFYLNITEGDRCNSCQDTDHYDDDKQFDNSKACLFLPTFHCGYDYTSLFVARGGQVVHAADQHVAWPRAVGGTDDALLLHLFDDTSGAGVADTQTTL